MLAPIICLSLFAVSAWASVELHEVLELPQAHQSLMESQRFKRQLDSDDIATQCVMPCVNDLTSTIQSLGIHQSASLIFNSRLYDPDTFNSFCGRVAQWSSCSGACSTSQTKTTFIQSFWPIVSLCGEDREEFESHQACYRDSGPQQNEVCDPKCGGPEEVQEQMDKLQSAGTAMDATAMGNRRCEMMSCHIDCRIPIIYAACKDKEAALFIGTWNQKFMKQALATLAERNLDIKCDDVINFDPDRFQINEDGVMVSHSGKHKGTKATSLAPKSTIYPGKSVVKNNLAPQTTRNNIVLITLCMVFAGFLL